MFYFVLHLDIDDTDIPVKFQTKQIVIKIIFLVNF